MTLVESVAASSRVYSSATGFDLDHDGLGEFILREATSGSLLEFYESEANNTFQLVHVLEFEDSGSLGDTGDADGDGLADLVTIEKIANDFLIRVYESTTSDTYPTELVWEVTSSGASPGRRIADTDDDGAQEIVIVDVPTPGAWVHVRIFENEGDNSFGLTFQQDFPDMAFVQSMAVLDDIDGDGLEEILVGGATGQTGFELFLLESTGNDAYQQIWSTPLAYNDPNGVNASNVAQGGDLDGDGKREFLAGGVEVNTSILVFHLFEATSDNGFEIVETFTQPFGVAESNAVASVADVDGDGHGEIVFGSGNTIRVYRNTGDNAWEEWWNTTTDNTRAMASGDHDGDGMEEVILSEGVTFGAFTAIREIVPQCGADMDRDDVVDAIDNCPEQSNPGQEDTDTDGAGNPCDCAPLDPLAFDVPLEIKNVRWLVDAVTVEWDSDAPNSGTGTRYDVVRGDLGELPVGGAGEMCLETASSDTSSVDLTLPLSQSGFYYLVRGENICGIGSYGTDSLAVPRATTACP